MNGLFLDDVYQGLNHVMVCYQVHWFEIRFLPVFGGVDNDSGLGPSRVSIFISSLKTEQCAVSIAQQRGAPPLRSSRLRSSSRTWIGTAWRSTTKLPR